MADFTLFFVTRDAPLEFRGMMRHALPYPGIKNEQNLGRLLHAMQVTLRINESHREWPASQCFDTF